jgi:hypothetical protein
MSRGYSFGYPCSVEGAYNPPVGLYRKYSEMCGRYFDSPSMPVRGMGVNFEGNIMGIGSHPKAGNSTGIPIYIGGREEEG